MQARTGQTAAHTPRHPAEHYEPLRHAFPEWLGQASAARRQALKNHQRPLADKLKQAPRAEHDELRATLARRMNAQNTIDRKLAQLQDAAAYAEPILSAALKNRFDLDIDVRSTCLRLYIPVTTPGLPITTGSRTWTVSLLDAALHNFEASETEAHAYSAESTYISRPSATGQFETLPQLKAKISIAAFARLCRELDIGASYKTYLEDNLAIDEPVATAVLRLDIDASEKAAIQAALQMARINGDVSELYVRLIGGLLDGLQGMRVDGQALLSHDLTMMSSALTGIIVFAPDLEQARDSVRVVAYVPDDPEHPIKEYASTVEMMQELTRQLRAPEYQTFFSRFVAHDQRGPFFADLGRRLSQVTWHQPEAGSALPAWRDTPIETPQLQFVATPIVGDLFEHLYQRKLNKILNDAATLAVATATVDRNARWAIWDSMVKVASSILEVASFVLMPFVPFLGEMMMAYMAYQFLDGLFEGVVDWAEGLANEAGEHFFAALESLVQLGAFGLGGAIAVQELPKLLPAEFIALVDRCQPVKLRNGKTLYWKPDLKPYEHPVSPPEGATRDARGLIQHQGKTLLRGEDAHYALTEHPHPDKYRIAHPSRADAYQPIVRHNGEGAFHTELEQPLSWDTATALKRIGHSVEGFSPARRERILKVSGYRADALRKMHVNRESVPPLLADSIQRFRLDQALQDFVEQIGSHDPAQYLKADQQTQLQLLKDHHLWPAEKRLRLLDAQGEPVWESSADDSLALTTLRQDQLSNGDLLTTLLQTLGDSELNTLLGENPGDRIALEVRARQLRSTLAQLAREQRPALFENRYAALQHSDDPLASKVRVHEPHLPLRITRELLNTATGDELLAINAGNWPERQQQLAAQARQALRITRAYEGLELESVHNPDSDTLALHSLERLPGWSADVRLEVRDGAYEGKVVDSSGAVQASIHKVLVRNADGTWQPYDSQGKELHAPTDFYTAVLQALPDRERQALGLQIGESAKLKQAIADNPLQRSELRLAIAAEPVAPVVNDTLRLVGLEGYPIMAPRPELTLPDRIREVYPGIANADLTAMEQTLLNHPDGAIAELSRLRLEYAQLEADLNQWRTSTPRTHPVTGRRLSSQRRLAAERNRDLFSQELLKCWRRESREAYGYRMRFAEPLLGDLPTLSADFSHVASLELTGSGGPAATDGFIAHFPGLQRLDLRHFDLRSLPQGVTRMPLLRQLRLRNCRLTLTSADQALLSALPELSALDLQGNRLGANLDVGALPGLSHLNLTNTGLTELPGGLLEHVRLKSVWLRDNRISTLPDSLFQLPADASAGFDFADNPWSAATRERVKGYFNLTGKDFGIHADRADIERVRRLFPDLNNRQANELFYRLPGSLLQGRLQVGLWQSELVRLTSELNTWSRDIPDRDPVTGNTLTPNEQADELNARETFAWQVQRLWRQRSRDSPLNRGDYFSTDARFLGDMPQLSADFGHITNLSLNGNKGIRGTSAFLRSFPGLRELRLRHFDLDQVPQTLGRLPRLESLILNDCGVSVDRELQAALEALPNLESLELPNNPLGSAPQVAPLTELTYLDLSNAGIRQVSADLAEHPKLQTVIVSDNQLTELPEAFFQLPARKGENFDCSNNPLSAETRERIKAYSREHGHDLGVLADQADIDALKALFPALDSEEASDVFYGLPGSLEHGRSQIRHWQAELEQMTADLGEWKTAIPDTHPLSGQPLNTRQLIAEHTARQRFTDQLLEVWRTRSGDNPRQRAQNLQGQITFIGDLPALSTDFSHVSNLTLHGNAAVTGVDRFLEAFAGVSQLDLQNFSLGDIPTATSRMPQLGHLLLRNCAVKLTPEVQATLASLAHLQYLDLSHNPLGAPPQVQALPRLKHIRLTDTGISSLPDGVFTHPQIASGIFDDNLIETLPDALFTVPAVTHKHFSLAGNPLSAASRLRIKQRYRLNSQDFGVWFAREDLERTTRLFPDLSDEAANRVLYLLPGTLEDGQLRLANWEAEFRQLSVDLGTWVDDVPNHHPISGESLSADDRSAETAARRAFGKALEDLWRSRLTDRPEIRKSDFRQELPFIGELPSLSVDFGHISSLTLEGQATLRVNEGFLQSFSGLKTLELRNLAVDRLPEAIARMPALETLAMSSCGMVLDAQGSATLSSLANLKALDLYNNPLGMSPDLRALPRLELLDLSGTGITATPVGLENHPALKTAILNNNWITDIPEPVFNLPNSTIFGFDFGNNPLSSATRERIKVCFQRTGEDLGVMADSDEMLRAQALYPSLSDEQASQFIYGLKGTLLEGRNELARREDELRTLIADLDTWTSNVPQNNPDSQMPLDEGERLQQELTRSAFKEALLRCWRNIPVEGSGIEDHGFASRLSLAGELPTLKARFEHVPDLFLIGFGDYAPRLGHFLEAFPNLDSLDIRGYFLPDIPQEVFNMGRLTSLSLSDCDLTLTAQTVNELASMDSLEILHLRDNPLGLTPDLRNLQSLTDLDLSNTGLTEIPPGVLENFNWSEVDLSNNFISEMPDELMEVPGDIGDRYDLSNNAFSERARRRIHAYYEETGQTLNVENIADQPGPTIRPDAEVEH
jgi:Leucine-rich repeat (LRR) protein